ncbi:MAG: hypothetical protein FWF53_11135 [Candidatus Azobacteroides sp.]|nr:hypothetical protein [Candidatus Azobacteroides sp.]
MVSDRIICNRCGAENPSYSKYCRGCGYELPKIVVENTVPEKPVGPAKKKVALSLTIGLVIGGLFIGIIIGTLIGATASFVYFNGANQSSQSSSAFDKPLLETTDRINRNLPVMIDSETRLDNMITLDKKTFQYNYTLVNMEKGKVDTIAMKNKLEPLIINGVKTSPDAEYQRKNEMTLVHYYKDKNGNYLFSVIVTPDKYK